MSKTFQSVETYPWQPNVDYEKNPHLYKIGKGQQGVLICQPYKTRLHPIWRFKTVSESIVSREKIYQEFIKYLDKEDFVGADMCKKYLHMGFTRARRYANHKSGKKYSKDGSILPQEKDWSTSEKAESSKVFYEYWVKARTNKTYIDLKNKFLNKYEI